MRLTDLSPEFGGYGGAGILNGDGTPVPRRAGIGIFFDCPCGCGERRYVDFANPVDGGPPIGNDGRPRWTRTGETFDALSLTPSINIPRAKGGCGWHGVVTDGAVTGQVE